MYFPNCFHNLTEGKDINSCHVTSGYVTSGHVTSGHVTSGHVTSCHVTSCHVISTQVTSGHVTSDGNQTVNQFAACRGMSLTTVLMLCGR